MTLGAAVLIVVLLLANGFFVCAEFALIAARRSHIEHLANQGNRRAVVAMRSIRELSLMLAGAQLGITMASLGLGAVAEPSVAHVLEQWLSGFQLSSAITHSIAFVAALTIVVFFHMVIGEMAPKNIAIARPEGSALWLAYPIRIYSKIFRPFLVALNGFANAVLRAVNIEPRDELSTVHTAEEIGMMVKASHREGAIDQFQERVLSGIAGFNELDAGAVLVPRTDMVAVPITATPATFEDLVNTHGHSRFPVYSEDSDRILGFFHSKDLLRIPEGARDKRIPRRLIRSLLVVPESRKLFPLLRDMRRERTHVALVLDEHGGTAGIVTLEDVLEELVGDIQDEHDMSEAGIEQLGEDRYLAPGTLRIDEAESRLGVHLPAGEYETIAGFLMSSLGRIPKRLDHIEHDGWDIRVQSMRRRRVVQVLIQRHPAAGAAGDE